MSAVPPRPFYYLENFQHVLDWIAARYDDLLAADERRFIARFPALPLASRALLVRMVMRKGPLFRSGKLRYDEIGCPDLAADALVAEGWLERHPPLDVDALFGLLTKSEILRVFRLSGQASLPRKAELLACLRGTHAQPARPLHAWHADLEEGVYAMRIAPLCERLRLMYFGNLNQTWSEFVLSDLGIYRFEQVAFSPSSRGFTCRRDVDDYLHLHRCRERLEQDADLDDVAADMPMHPLENAWLESRRHRLLYRLAQRYEKDGALPAALATYRACRHPGARLRRLRILERGGDIEAAHALAQKAADAPESEAEHQALQRLLPRLRRRLGHPRATAVPAPAVERIDLALPMPDAPASVEWVVRDHLSSPEAPVFYVENTLLNALFGLLCWPAIFAPLPGAFFHPFHHGPADLHSADFRQRRAHLFADCLAQLDDGRHRATILGTYHAKQGIQSPFVFWQVLDEALLRLALDCLPPAHLRLYFARMLADLSANCAGLPDLIQFQPAEKCYRMIEVKGPGDRLQDNQQRWLHYCAAHGLPVAVCTVRWKQDA